MSDNKTLADAQPGGRVRLGDQAERARFEAWAHAQSYRGGNIMADRDSVHPDVYADPIAQLTWKSWQAALSAQPSPGGQDAPEIEQLRALVSSILNTVSMGHQKGPYAYAGEDFGRHLAEAARDCRTILRGLSDIAARQPVVDQHPDDLAVDAFATAMKAKMADARAKGRGGWEDPAQCTADDLSRMLRDHVDKGDPRDVANFCMMLHQRGEAIAAPQPVGVPVAFAVESKAFEAHAASRKLNLCQHPLHYLFLDPVTYEARQAWKAALVFAPPAQAVDLGHLRVLADHATGRINHANNGLCPDQVEGHDTRDPDCPVCRALIDSQAVGNG